MAGTEPHAWGTGRMDDITYVGLDVHKATVCVAVAESGRGIEKVVARLRRGNRGSRQVRTRTPRWRRSHERTRL